MGTILKCPRSNEARCCSMSITDPKELTKESEDTTIANDVTPDVTTIQTPIDNDGLTATSKPIDLDPDASEIIQSTVNYDNAIGTTLSHDSTTEQNVDETTTETDNFITTNSLDDDGISPIYASTKEPSPSYIRLIDNTPTFLVYATTNQDNSTESNIMAVTKPSKAQTSNDADSPKTAETMDVATQQTPISLFHLSEEGTVTIAIATTEQSVESEKTDVMMGTEMPKSETSNDNIESTESNAMITDNDSATDTTEMHVTAPDVIATAESDSDMEEHMNTRRNTKFQRHFTPRTTHIKKIPTEAPTSDESQTTINDNSETQSFIQFKNTDATDIESSTNSYQHKYREYRRRYSSPATHIKPQPTSSSADDESNEGSTEISAPQMLNEPENSYDKIKSNIDEQHKWQIIDIHTLLASIHKQPTEEESMPPTADSLQQLVADSKKIFKPSLGSESNYDDEENSFESDESDEATTTSTTMTTTTTTTTTTTPKPTTTTESAADAEVGIETTTKAKRKIRRKFQRRLPAQHKNHGISTAIPLTPDSITESTTTTTTTTTTAAPEPEIASKSPEIEQIQELAENQENESNAEVENLTAKSMDDSDKNVLAIDTTTIATVSSTESEIESTTPRGSHRFRRLRKKSFKKSENDLIVDGTKLIDNDKHAVITEQTTTAATTVASVVEPQSSKILQNIQRLRNKSSKKSEHESNVSAIDLTTKSINKHKHVPKTVETTAPNQNEIEIEIESSSPNIFQNIKRLRNKPIKGLENVSTVTAADVSTKSTNKNKQTMTTETTATASVTSNGSETASSSSKILENMRRLRNKSIQMLQNGVIIAENESTSSTTNKPRPRRVNKIQTTTTTSAPIEDETEDEDSHILPILKRHRHNSMKLNPIEPKAIKQEEDEVDEVEGSAAGETGDGSNVATMLKKRNKLFAISRRKYNFASVSSTTERVIEETTTTIRGRKLNRTPTTTTTSTTTQQPKRKNFKIIVSPTRPQHRFRLTPTYRTTDYDDYDSTEPYF